MLLERLRLQVFYMDKQSEVWGSSSDFRLHLCLRFLQFFFKFSALYDVSESRYPGCCEFRQTALSLSPEAPNTFNVYLFASSNQSEESWL